MISQPLWRFGPRFGSTKRLEVGFGGEVVIYSGSGTKGVTRRQEGAMRTGQGIEEGPAGK